MDCKDTRQFITLYIDGMLDEVNAKKVEKHLKECPECYTRFKEIKQVVTLVGELEEVDIPDGFSERLRMRLETQQVQNTTIRERIGNYPHWVKWVGMVAAVLVIVLSMRVLSVLDPRDEAMVATDTSAMSDSAESVAMEGTGQDTFGNNRMGEKLTDYEKEFPRSDTPDGLDRADDGVGDEGEIQQEVATGFPAEEYVEEETETMDYIRTDMVELMVQDVCVTPQTLMTKALQHGINVLDVSEDDITLQFTEEEQKKVLYEELKMVGTVRDVGTDFNTDIVLIIIIHDE